VRPAGAAAPCSRIRGLVCFHGLTDARTAKGAWAVTGGGIGQGHHAEGRPGDTAQVDSPAALVRVLVRVYSHSLLPNAETGDLDGCGADRMTRRMSWPGEEKRISHSRVENRQSDYRAEMAFVGYKGQHRS